MRRPARLLLTLGLLVLLLVAGIQQSAASLAIFWRSALLSWDNPHTQWLDEVATQGAVYADARAQARDQHLLLRPSGRLATAPTADRRPSARLAADLTRSPPAR